MAQITILKRAFKIKEGDFIKHRKNQVKDVVIRQLEYMFKDGEFSTHEELEKVNLQDIFDLGYDQYLEFYNEFKSYLK